MRRLSSLLGMCLVVALMITSAAGAQTSGGQATIAGGAPLPPEFVLYSDGDITIGGDVGTDCYTFVTYGYPQTTRGGQLQEGAQAVADACEQLGLPRGNSDPFDAEVILSIPANPPPGYDATGKALPDTGGIPLVALAGGLVGSIVLIGFGSLMLKKSLNYR